MSDRGQSERTETRRDGKPFKKLGGGDDFAALGNGIAVEPQREAPRGKQLRSRTIGIEIAKPETDPQSSVEMPGDGSIKRGEKRGFPVGKQANQRNRRARHQTTPCGDRIGETRDVGGVDGTRKRR